MKNRMNKKALTFGITLVLIVIVLMAVAIYSFVAMQKTTLQSTKTSQAILEFEQEQTRLKIYAEQSAILTASQTIYEMSQKSMVNSANCFYFENSFIWEDSCKPEQLDFWFSEKFKKSFSDLMDQYPKKIKNLYINFTNNTIIIQDVSLFKEVKKPVNYNITFKFDKLVEINLSNEGLNLEEIQILYSKIIAAKQSCNNDPSCIQNRITLKNWDMSITSQSGYLAFNLETKELFSINSAGTILIEKIKLNFFFRN